MSRATHAEFDAIVLGGSRADRGMVAFSDVLTAEDASAVHAFLVKRAHDN
jgi:quinohemoprotein ethanol dehydrogenase